MDKTTVPKFGSFRPKSTVRHSDDQNEVEPHISSDAKSPPSDRRRKDRSHHHGSRDHRKSHDVSSRSFGRGSRERPRHHRRSPGRSPERVPSDKHSEVVANPDEVAESSLFVVDRRGDAKNVEYRSLHRYAVPSYRRFGYGRLIGLPSVKLDRDESTEKLAVLLHPHGRSHAVTERPLRSKLMATAEKKLRFVVPSIKHDHIDALADFVPLCTGVKRRRISEPPDSGPTQVDYRSLDGKATTLVAPAGDDLDFVSDSDEYLTRMDADLVVRQEHATLANNAKESPHDVNLWKQLIEHQAKIMRPSGGKLTMSELRTVADLRLAIHDRALKHVEVGESGREDLLISRLEEGALVWETSKLTASWLEVLEMCPGSTTIWTKYLDFVQTNYTEFRYEKCKAAYANCLRILQRARRDDKQSSLGVGIAQVYVLLRLTAFVQDAGYDELAFAIWQAVLEYHSSKPESISDAQVSMVALENFWDADVPRIGEEGALGWSHFYKHDDRNHVRRSMQTPLGPLDLQKPFQSFAHHESAAWTSIHLAAPIDDKASPDEHDPFRHVMFSDIENVIETLLDDLPARVLFHAYLVFQGLPSLAHGTLIAKTRDWQADVYLTRHVDLDTNDVPGYNIQQTSFSLFYGASAAFELRTANPVKSFGEFGLFIERILERLVGTTLDDDALAEYFLAFKCSTAASEVAKIAKRLLKQRPSSLRLYNAYALVEARSGNAEKAEKVWETAIAMSSDFADISRDDTVILWHSWVMHHVSRGDDFRALQCLTRMLNGQPDTGNESTRSPGLTAALALKASYHFDTEFERLRYRHHPTRAALAVECYMLFTYFAEGKALDRSFAVMEKYLAKLTANDDTMAARELLYQAQAAIIARHLEQHRPYKPTTIKVALRRALGEFPSNSLLLDVHNRLAAQLRLEDRVLTTAQNHGVNENKLSVIAWQSKLQEEIRRCDARAPGATQNSVRSAFVRALLAPDSVVKHSMALWMMWLRFESQMEMVDIKPSKSLAPPSRPSALERTKQVFLDGLRYLPWSKTWVITGMQLFAQGGGMTTKDLKLVYDVLAERELRVRVNLDEMENAVVRLGLWS